MAQGLAAPRPAGRIDARHFRRFLRGVGVLQLDSVNALARAHYLTAFARLGPYDPGALDDYLYRRGEAFEYWGHMASCMPLDQYPLLRHRMQSFNTESPRVQRLTRDHPGYLAAVLEEVRRRGPLTVSDLEDPGERTGPWWGHGKGKIALDYLFDRGEIGSVRTTSFTRVYDLAERMFPPSLLAGDPLPKPQAHTELVRIAARRLGVATVADLADYYRIKGAEAAAAAAELVAAGELEEVEVQGWGRPAYLHREARRPRRVGARALLCPFDSLIWDRARTERLFDFHYRIEIYTPAAQRRYGYYTLPFLLDDEIVGRVALRADRRRGRLVAEGAFGEQGTADRDRAAAEMAQELTTMAAWLRLDEIEVAPTGDLAAQLGRALR